MTIVGEIYFMGIFKVFAFEKNSLKFGCCIETSEFFSVRVKWGFLSYYLCKEIFHFVSEFQT